MFLLGKDQKIINKMLKVIEPIQTNLEIIIEWVVLTLSVMFIVLGSGGLLLVITSSNYKSDVLLQYAYVFIYTYMLILGIFLIAYRKKIIKK